MRPVTFFANASSPHVRHWVEMRDPSIPTQIVTIHTAGPVKEMPANVTSLAPLPKIMAKLPSTFQYIALGLWARFRGHRLAAKHIHAHNTSGYGFAAWLSGHAYGVTTYGTEIFGADKRTAAYRWMIEKVLKNAAWITASSVAMERRLTTHFSVPMEKISTFSLGIPQPYFDLPQMPTASTDSYPTWFVNRRIHPHYDTLRVVDGFKNFARAGGKGHLVLLAGDADPTYLKQVQNAIADISTPHCSARIVFQFLNQNEMIALLDSATFTISVPFSDQLSSSILEGAARGAIPMVRDLTCYDAIRPITYQITADADGCLQYQEALEDTARMDADTRYRHRAACMTMMQKRYAPSVIATYLEKLYGKF